MALSCDSAAFAQSAQTEPVAPAMQIELVAPASEDSAFLPRRGLGILAALTPPEDEVIYHEHVVRPFDVARDLEDRGEQRPPGYCTPSRPARA